MVRPGVYLFTHRERYREDEGKGQPFIFTTIEWVRPPDPVKDYQAEWMSKNFTAGQVIANSIRRYPTLYNGPEAVQRVADNIFCMNGGGRSWHENGFVQFDPDMKADDPEVKVPLFDKEYDWYPMWEEASTLCRAAKGGINLNPSFLALARNILECILKHGSGENSGNVKIARQCLENLNKRYPLEYPRKEEVTNE